MAGKNNLKEEQRKAHSLLACRNKRKATTSQVISDIVHVLQIAWLSVNKSAKNFIQHECQ